MRSLHYKTLRLNRARPRRRAPPPLQIRGGGTPAPPEGLLDPGSREGPPDPPAGTAGPRREGLM